MGERPIDWIGNVQGLEKGRILWGTNKWKKSGIFVYSSLCTVQCSSKFSFVQFDVVQGSRLYSSRIPAPIEDARFKGPYLQHTLLDPRSTLFSVESKGRPLVNNPSVNPFYIGAKGRRHMKAMNLFSPTFSLMAPV